MSQFFISGGHSTGASASASVLPMYIQDRFLLGLTGLISLLSNAHSRVFSNITVWNHQFFGTQPSLWSNSHIYTWLLENATLTILTFVGKIMSLLFNMLFRFFMAAITLHSDSEAWENKVNHCFPICFPGSDGIGCHDLCFFECWVLRQLFHSPLSLSSRGSLVSLRFLPYEWCHLHILGYWYFSQQSWFLLVLHPALHFTWFTLQIS